MQIAQLLLKYKAPSRLCKIVVIFFFCFVSSEINLHSQKKATQDNKCLSITNQWLKESLVLTKNCVGFSAPVAARAFAYLSIGMYECGVENNNGYISMDNQLNGYKRTTWKKTDASIHWPHLYNYFSFKLINDLYENMPPENLKLITLVKDSIYKTYKKQLKGSTITDTENYADGILNDLKNWYVNDGGHLGYNRNFPKTYKMPVCKSCWELTFPGYLGAQLPYWGSNKLLVESNRLVLDSIHVPEFSTDTSSAFYKDALLLFEHSLSTDPNIEIIGEYWDDAPGYSGTPTGHWYSMALQLSKNRHFNLQQSLHLYALLGISINDAFIMCWKTKYLYNLIRPITYIQQYISPSFNTIITTPPFPEFPSGHSFQSSAAGEVFKHFFSDTLSITDSTNIYRKDINGKPRTFKNVSSMVNEISISRFYGGIHFMNTLNLSVNYGSYLGKNSIHQLHFKK